jgi:hypothetical protein
MTSEARKIIQSMKADLQYFRHRGHVIDAAFLGWAVGFVIGSCLILALWAAAT